MRMLLGILVMMLYGCGGPIDSTDSPTERSGMLLLIDHGTGCHYLSRNGITPRLDASGKQICGPTK